jgi:hypothetical protein
VLNEQLNQQLSEVESGVLLQLINHYDQYIQNAIKHECYQHADWEPLTIEEFYETEFLLPVQVTRSTKQLDAENEVAVAGEEQPNNGWSTFSKHEILKPKQKPWWRRLLPW